MTASCHTSGNELVSQRMALTCDQTHLVNVSVTSLCGCLCLCRGPGSGNESETASVGESVSANAARTAACHGLANESAIGHEVPRLGISK